MKGTNDVKVADVAQIWQAAGVSVIPIIPGGQKRPAFAWSPYQVSLPTPAMVSEWWGGDTEYGLALICGGVSGNLEMTEIEGRVFEDPNALLEIIGRMDEIGAGAIWDLLTGPEGYAEDSPSGGMHLLYRIVDEVVPGNVKVARRMATPEELEQDPRDRFKVLAETRGQGGYVIVAPTSGACHKTGTPWNLVNGNYGRLPAITWAQRNLLHRALFLALDEMPEAPPVERLPAVVPERPPTSTLAKLSPGDDFEARTDWTSILVPHGWQPSIRLKNGEREWTRPGKTMSDGISATTGRANDRDRLYVFSTSTEFEAEVPYTKFGAYALLNHGGDHRAAAQTLARLGFGERRDVVDVELGEFVPQGEPQENIGEESYFTHDDTGNGERLAHRVRDTFRYIYEEKSWYHFDGKAWKRDTGGAITREFIAITDQMLRDPQTESWAKKSRSRDRINAAIKLAETQHMSFSATEWAPVRHLVNVENGVLNLKDQTLVDHHPKHLITHTLGAAYQPGATCPNFTRFMAKAIPDDDMRAYVQRALGYSLLGDASQRAIFLIYGPSGTGKSTLIETMSYVFGDYAATAGSGAFRAAGQGGHGPSADLHALQRRRFVTTSETSDNATFDEDLLKRLSGRDRVTSRGLFQEPVEWVPELTLWVATNNPPKFSSDDDAIWRRTKLIPFTTVFRGENEIPDYARTSLYHEAPGILAWLLAGLKDYLANGLGEPEEILTLARQQRQDSDSVSRFIEDKISEGALVMNPGMVIDSTKLFNIYKDWARGSGEQSLGMRRFILRLESGYPNITRGPNHRTWLGIGWQQNEFLGLGS